MEVKFVNLEERREGSLFGVFKYEPSVGLGFSGAKYADEL